MPAALEEALLVLKRLETPPEGDFAFGDHLAQLERGKTERKARSYFRDTKHRVIKLTLNKN